MTGPILARRHVELLRHAGRGRVRRSLSGFDLLDPANGRGYAARVSMDPLLAVGVVDKVKPGEHYWPNEDGLRVLKAEDARPSEYPTPTSEGTRP